MISSRALFRIRRPDLVPTYLFSANNAIAEHGWEDGVTLDNGAGVILFFTLYYYSRSTDNGLTFTYYPYPMQEKPYLRSAYFDGGEFLITISLSRVYKQFKSIDGILWVEFVVDVPCKSYERLATIISDGNLIYMGKVSNDTYSSVDGGVTWNKAVDSGSCGTPFKYVYGNGVFVYINNLLEYSASRGIAYSVNGETFESVNLGLLYVKDVYYSNGVFIVVGLSDPRDNYTYFSRSVDGINWSPISKISSTRYIGAVRSSISSNGAGEFFVLLSGRLSAKGNVNYSFYAKSTDNGVTWTSSPFPSPYYRSSPNGSISYAGGKYWMNAGENVLTTTDFVTFNNKIIASTNTYYSAIGVDTVRNKVMSVAGKKAFLSSDNGVSWTVSDSSDFLAAFTPDGRQNKAYLIANNGAGTWVVTPAHYNYVLTSVDDGVTWNKSLTLAALTNHQTYSLSVFFNGALFILAVYKYLGARSGSNYKRYTSPDGLNWTIIKSVSLPYTNSLSTSSQYILDAKEYVLNVVYVNGMYISDPISTRTCPNGCSSWGEVVFTRITPISVDGLNWNYESCRVSAQGGSIGEGTKVMAYGNGIYLLSYTNGGSIWYTSNFRSFSKVDFDPVSDNNSYANAVFFDGDKFILYSQSFRVCGSWQGRNINYIYNAIYVSYDGKRFTKSNVYPYIQVLLRCSIYHNGRMIGSVNGLPFTSNQYK